MKKNTTKQSKSLTKKPNRKPRKKASHNFKPKELKDIPPPIKVSFNLEDEIVVEENIDSILDFLNSFPEDLKRKVMDELDTTRENHDKALFFSSQNKEGNVFYLILCNVVTLDEKGLILFASKNKDLLSLYMSNITTMSYERVQKAFEDRNDQSKNN